MGVGSLVPGSSKIDHGATNNTKSFNDYPRPQKRKISPDGEKDVETSIVEFKRSFLEKEGYFERAIRLVALNQRARKRRTRNSLNQQGFLDWM
ncbi:hypothetical protein AYI69_g2516 [Smittium culicis]|uniref:Uncharacterized protein n=1 Tax=Smittium culicis TaxID=133412 RepID=A0A1R1YME1_9FUNG|nr:hypothetical protein AYI69_g3595 [Smittium culicis]OMJ28020.1 hypothetical protein AYI69_g2516 [Smittium culicis]